jgi:hypothetical protein
VRRARSRRRSEAVTISRSLVGLHAAEIGQRQQPPSSRRRCRADDSCVAIAIARHEPAPAVKAITGDDGFRRMLRRIPSVRVLSGGHLPAIECSCEALSRSRCCSTPQPVTSRRWPLRASTGSLVAGPNTAAFGASALAAKRNVASGPVGPGSRALVRTRTLKEAGCRRSSRWMRCCARDGGA